MGFHISENYGRLLENCVSIELLRRQHADPSTELFYWKSDAGHEIDFVVRHGTEGVDLIQACWNLDNPKTRVRELRALQHAMAFFRTNKGMIVTLDSEGSEQAGEGTVSIIPLWKWLLAERTQ